MYLSLFSLGGIAITQCDLDVYTRVSGPTKWLYSVLKPRAVWLDLTFAGIIIQSHSAVLFLVHMESFVLFLNNTDVLNSYLSRAISNSPKKKPGHFNINI